MSVFVLDQKQRPLMPCSHKRARKLLACGRARVHRLLPLVIRLIDRQQDACTLQPLRLKLDPGSKVTGMALVRESKTVTPSSNEIAVSTSVVSLIEIVHRGRQISEALTARRLMRRRRRNQLRYRAPRFLNRGNQAQGWIAPSLRHRVDTTMAWVRRLRRWAPVTALSSELVRFDLQAIDNPEITGIEYQQGALVGYEVREYLLEKWGRACMYCDSTGIPLQIEHLSPKAKGGSNRVSNLGLACQGCNQKKGARDAREFLSREPARLQRILAQVKKPLKDAAAVNATRWVLANALKATGLPLELASGGRTKYNRSLFGIPKTHALDAACVGTLANLQGWMQPTLQVKCSGRGSYQRTRLDAYGFPRGYLMRCKRVQGFATGDMVKATVASGKKAGVHIGRVAVRASGSFNLQTPSGAVQGIHHRHCRLTQRGDGYGYVLKPKIAQHREGCENQGRASRAALSLPAFNGQVSREVG